MSQVETKRIQIEYLSDMIGMVIIWLFFSKIGYSGIAYITVVLELYLFLWSLTGAGISDSLGKVLRSRNSKGQYFNASRLRKNTLIAQGAFGALGGLILLVFSKPLANHILGLPYCSLLLCLIAPAVFLRTISSVLLGYFQGEGTELCGCIACILRQLFILGFGFLFLGIFGSYGEKISRLLMQNQVVAMYDSAGIVLSISMAELLIVLFLVLLYQLSKRVKKRKYSENTKIRESFLYSLQMIYHNMGNKVIVWILVFLPYLINMIVYMKSTEDTQMAVSSYGSYAISYLAVCGFVVMPVFAMLTPVFGKITGCMRKGEHRLARTVFQAGFHMSAIWALFLSAFLGSISELVTGVFVKTHEDSNINMLKAGSFIILFIVLGFYFTKLLLITGKWKAIVGSLGIYMILFLLSNSLMLHLGKAGIMSLVYSGVISHGIYALTLGFITFRQLRCGFKTVYLLAIPVIGASITGILSLLLGKLLIPHLTYGAAIVICAMIALICYFAILLLMRNIKEQELEHIPGGKLLFKLGEVLRVF